MFFAAAHTVDIRKIAQTEYLFPIHRHSRRRVQIWIDARMPEHGHNTGPQKVRLINR